MKDASNHLKQAIEQIFELLSFTELSIVSMEGVSFHDSWDEQALVETAHQIGERLLIQFTEAYQSFEPPCQTFDPLYLTHEMSQHGHLLTIRMQVIFPNFHELSQNLPAKYRTLRRLDLSQL